MNETRSTQLCSLGIMTTLLVWAAINATFLHSKCSLVFASALFFNGDHFNKEYWGNIWLSKYPPQKVNQLTQQLDLLVPPYEEVIDLISLLWIFKHCNNTIVKVFQISSHVCLGEDCQRAQSEADLEK